MIYKFSFFQTIRFFSSTVVLASIIGTWNAQAMENEDGGPFFCVTIKSSKEEIAKDSEKKAFFPLGRVGSDENHPLRKSWLGIIPSEIIFQIAGHLYNDNFHKFSMTCNVIRRLLLDYKSFFIPEENNKVRDIIIKAPFETIPRLISTWGRTNRGKVIHQLNKLLPDFEYTRPSEEEINLKPFYKKFKERIKFLYVLSTLGDKKAANALRDAYDESQNGIEEAKEISRTTNNVVITNTEQYIFYEKNLSLLDEEIRRKVARSYREGLSPFPIDSKKAQKYSKEFEFPWLLKAQ